MKCPYCKVDKNEVYATEPRYNSMHDDYKRYRRCLNCGRNFTTHEQLQEKEIYGECTKCIHYQHWKDGIYNCVRWVCIPEYKERDKT